jgi:hypothetical protein
MSREAGVTSRELHGYATLPAMGNTVEASLAIGSLQL